MTEAEWQAFEVLRRMLSAAEGWASDRKYRLFAAACCRRIWPSLTHEESRLAVEAAERFADGKVPLHEMLAANEPAKRVALEGARGRAIPHAVYCAPFAPAIMSDYGIHPYAPWDKKWSIAAEAAKAVSGVVYPDSAPEFQRQACLLIDILGDHLESPPQAYVRPCAQTRSIAEAAYQERVLPSGHLDTARLTVLADALEEAGCGDADLLTHLRSPGPHVRGCWALDLVLGKG